MSFEKIGYERTPEVDAALSRGWSTQAEWDALPTKTREAIQTALRAASVQAVLTSDGTRRMLELGDTLRGEMFGPMMNLITKAAADLTATAIVVGVVAAGAKHQAKQLAGGTKKERTK